MPKQELAQLENRGAIGRLRGEAPSLVIPTPEMQQRLAEYCRPQRSHRPRPRDKLFAASLPPRSRSSLQISVGRDYSSTANVRHKDAAPRSLHTCREYSLKMWALLFTRNNADLDLSKTSFFQKLMQLHFAESEPVVCVQFVGPFKPMAQKIENH